MKKILFLLTMLPMMCYGQNDFEQSFKISYEYPVEDNQSFGADFLVGYKLSEKFRIGLGVGSFWCNHLYNMGTHTDTNEFKGEDYKESAIYVPIYVNGKINFTRSGISPYFSVDLGYSFFIPSSEYAKDNKLGLYFKPSMGIDFPLSKGKIFTEIGYKYQKREWDLLDNPNYSQLVISLGYIFK